MAAGRQLRVDGKTFYLSATFEQSPGTFGQMNSKEMER